MKPRITNEGLAAQIRAMDGEGIVFTEIRMGNGAVPEDYRELTDLVNVVTAVGLTDFAIDEEEGYVQLKASFNNNSLQTSYQWTEVGIFIQDPDDEDNNLLYAYGHVDLESEMEASATIPKGSTELYEIELTYRVYVGEADNISARIAEYSVYATKAEFEEHIHDYNNPHRTTAEMVGLGNVPNVTTNDQEPTFTEAAELAPLESGEKLSVLLGKIAKAVSTLISHISNMTMHITSSDRTRWNNKASSTHYHSASDINSGVLPVARGGTGGSTPFNAANNVLSQGADKMGGELIFKASVNNSIGGEAGEGHKWRVGGSTIDRLGNSGTIDPSVKGYAYLDSAFPTKGTGSVHAPIVCRQYHRLSDADAQRYNNDPWQCSWGYVMTLAYLLDASGNTKFPGTVTSHANTISSDRKLKENIKSISQEEAIRLIMALDPVHYNWKSDNEKRGSMGFIAQDVYDTVHSIGIKDSSLYNADMKPKNADDMMAETCLSDAAIESHDDSELQWSLDYQQLIAPLVKVIQSQELRIRQLEEKLRA